jgi:hypothetical protein
LIDLPKAQAIWQLERCLVLGVRLGRYKGKEQIEEDLQTIKDSLPDTRAYLVDSRGLSDTEGYYRMQCLIDTIGPRLEGWLAGEHLLFPRHEITFDKSIGYITEDYL